MQHTLCYRIWGWAAAFTASGEIVVDRSALEELSKFIDDEDLYFTDYIDGTNLEDSLSAGLERSGQLRFELRTGEEMLRINTDFIAKRTLSEEELSFLKEYALGQWSDGMGECLFVPRGTYKDYKLQPLDRDEVGDGEYPFVEISQR